MLGDLSCQVAVPQLQTGLQQSFHRQREGGCRRRPNLRHLLAACQQMPQTTLMERRCESIIRLPSVMHQKPIVIRAQNDDRLFISAPRQDGIHRHLRAHRYMHPLQTAAHFPASLIGHVHRGLPRGFHQPVIAGRRPPGQARQRPVQSAATDFQLVTIGQHLPRMPQRESHLLVEDGGQR